ncbi:MAG TPA: hypothetical protein VH278_03360 [Burkholderiaceae bacterium]|jgi:hypothetical protein|nr:hypothetical protein [Burkholderiaceae bacterium]
MTKAKPRPTRAVARFTPAACLSACLLLQGCGRSNSEPPPDILKAQREAMEKAKATEKVMQDAAQRHDVEAESQQK